MSGEADGCDAGPVIPQSQKQSQAFPESSLMETISKVSIRDFRVSDGLYTVTPF